MWIFRCAFLLIIGFPSLVESLAAYDDYSYRVNVAADEIDFLFITPPGKSMSNLMQGFIDVKAKAVNMTANDAAYYSAFYTSIEANIVNNNVDFPSDAEKLDAVAREIQNLQREEPQIYEQIWSWNITGWSTVINIVSIAAKYHIQDSLNLVRYHPDVYSPLLEWIETLPGFDGVTANYLTSVLEPILAQPGVPESVIIRQIYETLALEFFVVHPDKKKSFSENYNATFGGSFQQFMEVGKMYYQQNQYQALLTGSTTTSPFWVQFSGYISNTSIPVATRIVYNSFKSSVTQYFANTTLTPETRLQKLSWHFADHIDLTWNKYKVLGSMGFTDFGTFYELLLLDYYLEDMPTTGVPFTTTTTVPTTTTTTTLPTTTTTALPTTTTTLPTTTTTLPTTTTTALPTTTTTLPTTTTTTTLPTTTTTLLTTTTTLLSTTTTPQCGLKCCKLPEPV